MLLRPASRERLEAELRYVREMGLNTIRLEGKLETRRVLRPRRPSTASSLMPGWCCCDQWELWDKWDAEDHRVAPASLHDQILRLRNHPSVLVWMNGSDFPPPAKVEQAYLDVLEEARVVEADPLERDRRAGAGERPERASRCAAPTTTCRRRTGSPTRRTAAPSASPPRSGPGGAVPPLESLKQMLPADHLWPIDEVWNFHAGGDEFKDLKLFTEALEGRYGKATGRRRLRAQGPGAHLRGPARDVRGLRRATSTRPPASSSGCSTTPGPR